MKYTIVTGLSTQFLRLKVTFYNDSFHITDNAISYFHFPEMKRKYLDRGGGATFSFVCAVCCVPGPRRVATLIYNAV